MPRPFCASYLPHCRFYQHGLRVELLEDRRLLSVNQFVRADISQNASVAAHLASSGDLSSGSVVADEMVVGNAEPDGEANDGQAADTDGFLLHQGSLSSPSRKLAVPPDDSVDPIVECPGLDNDFCLPGDADLDYDVDINDFMVLSNNLGMTGANWEDGDFDGDGFVGYSDFVILANYFGQQLQPNASAFQAIAMNDDDAPSVRSSPIVGADPIHHRFVGWEVAPRTNRL